MLDWLLEIDKSLFIWLNGLQAEFLHPIMIGLSNKYLWVPMYLMLIYHLYRHQKSEFWKTVSVIILIIIVTDQVTSNLMKPYFSRLRPCADPGLQGVVAQITGCRKSFSLASGHAANSFALAGFFYFFEKKSMLGKLLMVWAFLVAYSRIYLGVHYPLDILIGAVLGIIVSWTALIIFKNWMPSPATRAY